MGVRGNFYVDFLPHEIILNKVKILIINVLYKSLNKT